MLTPRQKLNVEVEAIAAKHGLTVREAVHVGRRQKIMDLRWKIYRHVVTHYGGNLTAAGRYLGKDRTTLRSALAKEGAR